MPIQHEITHQADIFRDPRIRSIPWRDLVAVSGRETVTELLLPIWWLASSLFAASLGWYIPALALSFMFFLAGLRVVHNAFHYALGLPRWATDAVLWTMSLVMLGSMHAVRFNHLRHHRLVLGEADVEGRCAQMPWWKALLFGPAFTVLIHLTALRRGTLKLRATVLGELLMNAVWITAAYRFFHSGALRYHVIAMAAAHCFTAFFAVWTVHHHCDRTHYLARTLRNRIKNAITFDMFRHMEHHLYPAVPTCHLSELSVRLDTAAPELKQKLVF